LFLYNTLKINTLPDICNFYLRLLGLFAIVAKLYEI
jgi:hypothetical protein